ARRLGENVAKFYRTSLFPRFHRNDVAHMRTNQLAALRQLSDLDEAAGAADATAYGKPSIIGVTDVVWVTEKGDSCDPSTPDDAGGTSASQLLEGYNPLLLAGGS